MLQPLVFLVFFGPLLSGVVDLPGAAGAETGDTWLWFVPSVLIMLALFGTTGSGYMMLTEMQTGSHERLLVTPVNRTSMLVGRTLNDVATLLAQGLLIVVVVLPFGLRPHPLGMGPGWMQTLGRLNPLTDVVEAQRALFTGGLTEIVVLQGAVAVLALAVVGLALGTRTMRRAQG